MPVLSKIIPECVLGNRRYEGDHMIRHYRPIGLAAYHADNGTSGDSVTIIGGIGTLTMYADGREDWKPTLPHPQHSLALAPRLTDQALLATRQSVCQACDSMRDGRCSASGCGCAGEGKPDIWSSRCPLDRWPSIPCNS